MLIRTLKNDDLRSTARTRSQADIGGEMLYAFGKGFMENVRRSAFGDSVSESSFAPDAWLTIGV
jgi:hypothetical protein